MSPLSSTQTVNEWLERIVRRLYPQTCLRSYAERLNILIVFEIRDSKDSAVVIADGGALADKTLPMEYLSASKV